MSEEHHCKGALGEGYGLEGLGGLGGLERHGVTCREVSEFLLAYLERDLDPGARAEFELHLNRCPPCVHYLDGYRETVELVRRCTREHAEAGTDAGPQAAACEAARPKQRPPEGLIQAILAAKRSLDRG